MNQQIILMEKKIRKSRRSTFIQNLRELVVLSNQSYSEAIDSRYNVRAEGLLWVSVLNRSIQDFCHYCIYRTLKAVPSNIDRRSEYERRLYLESWDFMFGEDSILEDICLTIDVPYGSFKKLLFRVVIEECRVLRRRKR